MRFLESILYGILSGLAEFLPISAQAHQVLCMQLFGATQREPLRDLFVHIALILALYHACKALFDRIRRERSAMQQSVRKRVRLTPAKGLLDLRLVRTAAIPMLLVSLIYLAAGKWERNPAVVSILLVVNGIILIIPEYMRHGNRDARGISTAQAVLIGVASGFSAFPGISRITGTISLSTACGADRQNCANWALLLSVPALGICIFFDIINLFVIGFAGLTFLGFLGYIVSALVAYFSGYFSILLFRFLSEKAGFAGFAYYSWGAALFMFVLYLIT